MSGNWDFFKDLTPGALETATDLAFSSVSIALGIPEVQVGSIGTDLISGMATSWRNPFRKDLGVNGLLKAVDEVSDDDESPEVSRYLAKLALKKIGGVGVSLTGRGLGIAAEVFSFGTAGFNLTGAARHGTAVASTLVHIAKLQSMKKDNPKDTNLGKIVRFIIYMKAFKTTSKGLSLAADLIPNSIASTVVGSVGAIGTSLVISGLRKLIALHSAWLHYYAYFEAQANKPDKGLAIVQELFNHMHSGVLNEVDYKKSMKLMSEPAGHSAIYDKLTLV